ncbi:MAG: SgcJ/EcaC family oxidoreductase [Nitrospirae bacterium]|nr:SgcJ/EcaC family oxidoreductase [Nitrospirota bacterium]
MKKIVLLACILGMASIALAEEKGGRKADEDAIRKAWSDYTVAFNMRIPKNMTAIWSEDGDITNFQGRTAKGRNALETLFADEQATVLKDTRMIMVVPNIRFLKPDLALVDGDATVAGMFSLDGKPLVPQRLIVSSIVAKKDGKWMVLAARESLPGQWAKK